MSPRTEDFGWLQGNTTQFRVS